MLRQQPGAAAALPGAPTRLRSLGPCHALLPGGTPRAGHTCACTYPPRHCKPRAAPTDRPQPHLHARRLGIELLLERLQRPKLGFNGQLQRAAGRLVLLPGEREGGRQAGRTPLCTRGRCKRLGATGRPASEGKGTSASSSSGTALPVASPASSPSPAHLGRAQHLPEHGVVEMATAVELERRLRASGAGWQSRTIGQLAGGGTRATGAAGACRCQPSPPQPQPSYAACVPAAQPCIYRCACLACQQPSALPS